MITIICIFHYVFNYIITMSIVHDTFDHLLKIDILPSVLNVIVVEYLFSLNEEKKTRKIPFRYSNAKITTIKNKKIYIFDTDTFDNKISISNITEEHYNLKYNMFTEHHMFVDDNYVYVLYSSSVYIFDVNTCKMIKNVYIPVNSDEDPNMLIFLGEIILYYKDCEESYIYFFDMQGKRTDELCVEDEILCINIINNK